MTTPVRFRWAWWLLAYAAPVLGFMRRDHVPDRTEWWMAAAGTAIMAVVAVWLWLRPEPPRS